MVKCSWIDSQSSSGDVVHVFMSSFSEAADANITGSIMRTSVWVVNKPTRLRHILTQRQAEVIFKLSFCGLIFTNTSGSVLTRVHLCVCVCVCVCVRACVHTIVCVRTGAELRCARYRAQPCKLETEMTCRRVNKINNIRLFSLFDEKTRYRPVL